MAGMATPALLLDVVPVPCWHHGYALEIQMTAAVGAAG